MSEKELEGYYFGKIDLDTPDHVFVERALADYRAASCLGKYDDDEDWHIAPKDDRDISDYDLGDDAIEGVDDSDSAGDDADEGGCA
eukprot:6364744-Prymnesium_polylepis.1